MEKYKVIAVNIINNQSTDLIIKCNEDEISGDILLSTMIDGKTLNSKNYCYFEAFKELKDKLLALNYGLKCKGSLVNVVQSEMASASDKIYIVQLGNQASLKNLVSIYEYIDIDEFASKKEQDDFADSWYKSL